MKQHPRLLSGAVAVCLCLLALAPLPSYATAATYGYGSAPSQTRPVNTPVPTTASCACPKIYMPVCGSNGRTYDNECLATRCSSGVKVAYPGPCKLSVANATGSAAPGSTGQGAAAGCVCPMIYAPVCGVDGRTYGNSCTAANCGKGVKVAYQGACKAASTPAVTPGGSAASCVCTKIYKPVCGNDGHTYGNECQATRCNKGPVKVAYQGVCKAGGRVTSEPGVSPGNPSSDTAGCVCPMMYAPVCGVDGRTYGNSCVAGNCGKGVAVAYQGDCKAGGQAGSTPGANNGNIGADPAGWPCPAAYIPVCGVDGRTYSNDCIATNYKGVKVAYQGPCKDNSKPGVTPGNPGADPADCVCPAIYAPVCGVDGRTYDNSCVATGCGKGVKVAYQGPCKALGNIISKLG